ncbi:MAG TPA: hypothetical protein VFK94_02205, partial [Patescibacteria group bacterium]|nr:hypothetical protein [Patescibacteria group bacterium]
MAVAFVKKHFEAQNKTGSTTLVASTDSAAVGNLVVLWIACDNAGGTDTPAISSIVDSRSNTWTVVASHGSATTSAATSTRGFIAVSVLTTALQLGDTITITFSIAIAAKVWVVAEFSGVTSTVSEAAVGSTSSSASLASPGPTGDLLLGLVSDEDNAAFSIASSNIHISTQPGGDGQVFTTGGGGAANVSMTAAYGVGDGTLQYIAKSTALSGDGGACIVALQAASTGTPIGKELGLVWNTRAPLGKNLGVVWNTRANSTKSLQVVWNDLVPVTKSLQTVWDVKTFVGKSIQTVWNTRAVL